jgi:hypothetical protein
MKKLRFLVSLMTRENDYQLEQAASAQRAAVRSGADVEIFLTETVGRLCHLPGATACLPRGKPGCATTHWRPPSWFLLPPATP